MVRHKVVRSLVVAASLVAIVITSMPRAFLLADEFPPPPNCGAAPSPQWDLNTLTIYESGDASITVAVDSSGNPVISAAVDQNASSGTFAFSVVSGDGFESMLVSGEVLGDGSISYQTVKANLAGATSSTAGAAAWAAADSEPGFWDDYWRYFWNPSDMDPELEIGFKASVATAGVALTAAGGLAVVGVNPVIIGGGGAAATGGGLAGAGGGAAGTGGGAATAGTGVAAGTGAAGGGALLGIEAEIAAAHAQIAAMKAQIAVLESGISAGVGSLEQIETAHAAIAILRSRIADLWAFIDFMLSSL